MRKSEREKLRGKKLSKRELEVLVGIASGLTEQQLADKYIASVNTIKSQRATVIRKLGAINSSHAVALGFKRGILVWPRKND